MVPISKTTHFMKAFLMVNKSAAWLQDIISLFIVLQRVTSFVFLIIRCIVIL